MKNKITTAIIGFSMVVGMLPASVFAQMDTSSYDYTSPSTSGYDYSSPTVSGYNYTSPTVSSYNYTSPTVSNYNYTSPTVSGYDYTSPTVSGYNYTSPTVSSYNYTSPTVSDYTTPSYIQPTYTTPTYISPTYTNPTYSSPTYTTPTYTSPTYTNPTYSSPTYTSPTYTNPNYSYTSTGYIGSTYSPAVNYPPTSVIDYGYPTQTITPVVNTTICSDGSAPVNGSCGHIVTIPVTNNTICSDGSLPINGVCGHTTITPVVNTTICSDGSAPINGSCNHNVVIPTSTLYTCPNGTVVSYSFQCPIITPVINYTYPTTSFTAPTYTYVAPTYTTPTISYQTCWDGSTIPLGSVCPSQYKVCANGSSIPVYQTCYVAPTPVYVAPVVVKFNNVVTSVTTSITNISARCNGIGLIANGANSTGWFEYGETANLGRQTAVANIGSSNTAPFSNVLTNLKPTTTYYCRAVMQNQYGLVKGEIVRFTTKSRAAVYVKPSTTVTKTITKTVKKNEIVCSDGSIITVNNQNSAEIINQGQKLVSVFIEKTDGSLSAGNQVTYRLSYKNISGSHLTGVVVKVTIPQEITFYSSSVGNYDETSHTLTLNQDTVDAESEGVVTFTGTVTKDAEIGKTIVTTAYLVYTVPSTKVQDEVTSYVVGSIVPSVDGYSDTGAKHVIGQNDGRGFLPNSLVEWLALVAILFIIFILGRSIYASYKNEDGHGHH